MLFINAVTYDQKSYFFSDLVTELSSNNVINECHFSDKLIEKYMPFSHNPTETK